MAFTSFHIFYFALAMCVTVIGKNLPPPPGYDPIQHLTSIVNEINTTLSMEIDELKKENNALKQQLGDTHKVGFSAVLTHSVKVGEHQPIEYDHIITNVGNGYEPRDGHFTAPIAGLYLFAYTCIGLPNERLHLDIVKNGVPLLRVFSGSGDYTMGSQVAVVQLEVGDMVWVIHSSEVALLTVYGTSWGENFNSFSGFLIG